jgi:hypothetical protein
MERELKKKIATNHNTDGWGNKLVTIFVRHLDNFILRPNISLFYLIRDSGSGQIRATGTRNRMASSGNVYSLNRRAVSSNNLDISEMKNSTYRLALT